MSRYPHTVIIISHDRDLLNNAVNSIVHLDQKKLTFYRGGYDQFERQKAEADELQTKAKAKNEAARKHLQSFIDRFKAKATKARQAQSASRRWRRWARSRRCRGSCAADHLPRAGEAARLADRRAQQRLGRL
jgi:ATP-binding cassette subfamily F protein 3